SGGLSKLCLVAGGQDLKLGNRLLVELSRRPAIHRVLVWLSVDEKVCIASALSKHRSRGVAARIGLAVDRNAGDELKQVEIVSPVNGQIHDLPRVHRASGRGSRRLKQLLGGGYADALLHRPNVERDVEGEDSVQRQLDLV